MVNYTEIISQYKDLPGGIITAFHAIQKEINYLPEEAIKTAAKIFNLPEKEAYGVATFYSYFSVEPRGKYVIRICESAPCHVAGVDEVVKALENALGIKMGQTTKDGKFTLEFTQCVGQCQDTPVITINGEPYGGVNADKVAKILASYK
ncbi:MAG: NADH-quinone oxidoreductase subunit NuoE [Bacillota bacterium]|jgi:NADH:ubiquinone oxidoreductase subunit E